MKSRLTVQFALLGIFLAMVQSCTNQLSSDHPLIAEIHGKEFVLVVDAHITEFYCGIQPYVLHIKPVAYGYGSRRYCVSETIGTLKKGSSFTVEGAEIHYRAGASCRMVDVSFEFEGHVLRAILQNCGWFGFGRSEPWILPESGYGVILTKYPFNINPRHAVPKDN